MSDIIDVLNKMAEFDDPQQVEYLPETRQLRRVHIRRPAK